MICNWLGRSGEMEQKQRARELEKKRLRERREDREKKSWEMRDFGEGYPGVRGFSELLREKGSCKERKTSSRKENKK